VIGGLERAQDLGRDGGHVVAAETERNGGTVIHVRHTSRLLQHRIVLAAHTIADDERMQKGNLRTT